MGSRPCEGAVVVPLAAEQPAIARQLAVELAQPLAELRLVRGVLERHLAEAQAAAEQVNVAVEEPGHDAAALQVDDARPGSDEEPHLGAAPHGEDAAVPDRDGLGLRLLLIDGPYFAAREHQIGRDRRFRAPRHCR